MKNQYQKNLFKDAIVRLGQIKILIADDDHRIAAIVKAILESVGFTQSIYAKNGEEAIQIMQKEKIDMVITDWQMSPVDGITLIKYLRTADDSPNRFMPIIMLTASVDKEHVEIARDSGVTEFVIKPFSARTLCDRIALLIDNPRNFIMTRNFTGPDRRRRKLLPPPGNVEKRKN